MNGPASDALDGGSLRDGLGLPEIMAADVGGFVIVLEACSGRWAYSGSAPAGANPVAYTHAVKEALIGAAMSKALNERLVPSRHMAVLAEHVSTLMGGRCAAATVDGVDPIAFQAAGMWVLNQIGADFMTRWASLDPADIQPLTFELLTDDYCAHDPLLVAGGADGDTPANIIVSEPDDIDELRSAIASVSADLHDEGQELLDYVLARHGDDPDSQQPGPVVASSGYVPTCVEQAYRHFAGGDHILIEPFPLTRLPDEATTNSPAAAASRTGLGSVIGGGLGACAAFYEAHTAAGTGAPPSGIIVMSAAHRDNPASEDFRRWVREHLNPPSQSPAGSRSHDLRERAVAGVLDVVAYDEPDADIAAAALATVADHAPDQFVGAVTRFAARFSSDTEMLACFDTRQRLAESISGALQRS